MEKIEKKKKKKKKAQRYITCPSTKRNIMVHTTKCLNVPVLIYIYIYIYI